MKKITLRELSPVILSVVMLSIFLVWLTSAIGTNNWTIWWLFKFMNNNPWWDYNWLWWATSSWYRLDGKNIDTNFWWKDLTTVWSINAWTWIFLWDVTWYIWTFSNIISLWYWDFAWLLKANSLQIWGLSVINNLWQWIWPAISMSWNNVTSKPLFSCPVWKYLESFDLSTGLPTCKALPTWLWLWWIVGWGWPQGGPYGWWGYPCSTWWSAYCAWNAAGDNYILFCPTWYNKIPTWYDQSYWVSYYICHK